MIASLRGTILETDGKSAVIECGGVGYRVKLSRFTLESLAPGVHAQLRVHTEFPNGEITLYGFLDRVEEMLFAKLISVPGVGGASALAILSAAPPGEIAGLIARRDLKGLTALPRVGKKLAERLVVELADALAQGGAGAAPAPGAPAGAGGALSDLVSALGNFGYAPREARAAAERALAADPGAPFERLFKHALRELSGR